jgi:hypothetical protein
MISKTPLRYLLGTFLGAMAGLSFCLSILPVALELVGAGDQAFLGMVLSRFAVYSALVWGVGGFSTARAGFLKAGMITMGLVGVTTGGLLVGLAIQASVSFLAAGILAGLFYGVVGGMVLGRILTPPVAEE